MLFKRKKISPEYLYLAIYTMQKKGSSKPIQRWVSRFDLESYLSCSPLMLTNAINGLISKGWIYDFKEGARFYTISSLSDAPALVDVTKHRSRPGYFRSEL